MAGHAHQPGGHPPAIAGTDDVVTSRRPRRACLRQNPVHGQGPDRRRAVRIRASRHASGSAVQPVGSRRLPHDQRDRIRAGWTDDVRRAGDRARREARRPRGGADAPEIALYESRREGDGWSRPQLLPLCRPIQGLRGLARHPMASGCCSIPGGRCRMAARSRIEEQPVADPAHAARLVHARATSPASIATTPRNRTRPSRRTVWFCSW